MDFAPSAKAKDFEERLTAFMDAHVYPAETIYHQQHREASSRWSIPPIIEELKQKARDARLWNLFLPDETHGAGLRCARIRPARTDHRPQPYRA